MNVLPLRGHGTMKHFGTAEGALRVAHGVAAVVMVLTTLEAT